MQVKTITYGVLCPGIKRHKGLLVTLINMILIADKEITFPRFSGYYLEDSTHF